MSLVSKYITHVFLLTEKRIKSTCKNLTPIYIIKKIIRHYYEREKDERDKQGKEKNTVMFLHSKINFSPRVQ